MPHSQGKGLAANGASGFSMFFYGTTLYNHNHCYAMLCIHFKIKLHRLYKKHLSVLVVIFYQHI